MKLNKSGQLFMLAVGLTSTVSLAHASKGGSSGGGGNDINGKSLAQYLKPYSVMSGAQKFDVIVAQIKQEVPQYAEELENTEKATKFYVAPIKNSRLSGATTGIYFDSEQTALHKKTGEVFVDRSLYLKKTPEEKLYFLVQEIFEGQLMSKHPEMDMQEMHASARTLTEFFLNPGVFPDERSIQNALVNGNVGYYATATQVAAAKKAEDTAPVQVQANSNVVILKNGVELDASKPLLFNVGDKIKFVVDAKDPQNATIGYTIVACPNSGGGGCPTWVNNSASNSMEYTFTEQDAKDGLFRVYLDLTNSVSSLRTEQTIASITVTDGVSRLPPVFNSAKILVNGSVLDTSKSATFRVGDKMQVVVDAKDPQNATIGYTIVACPNSGGGGCPTWVNNSASNSMEYTFTEQDAKDGLFRVYLDLTNSVSSLRTEQTIASITVTDGVSRLPPVFNSAKILVNGSVLDTSKSATFRVGDKMQVVVDAKDPQNATIGYTIVACPNSGGGGCPTWVNNSASNSMEYTFTEQDAKDGLFRVYLDLTNSVSSLRTEQTIASITVTDGVSRLAPQFIGVDLSKEGLHKLSKQEAQDLKTYLTSQNPAACAAIISSLDSFLHDNDTTKMEVLFWSTGQFDDATQLCLKIVQAATGTIFTSTPSLN